MLTPKEKIFLDEISTLPNIKMFIDRLDLIPLQSENYRKSINVSTRVDQIIADIKKTPAQPSRTIFTANTPFSLDGPFTPPSVTKAYLETIYGPQPWKYPLPFAPF
jgi:hypothetical protein